MSALETVHDLKLKIGQTLSIHPQNAALHVFQAGSWQLVTADSATLAGKLCCLLFGRFSNIVEWCKWQVRRCPTRHTVTCSFLACEADSRQILLDCIIFVCCAETSILPDQELIVVNTHEHDDDDLGSFFGAASSTGRSQHESGFRGTALTDYSVALQAPSALDMQKAADEL